MESDYSLFFKPTEIGGRTAPNLLVANAMERNDATPQGRPSSATVERYRRLAEGGWGILFVECTTASDRPEERGHFPEGLMLCDDTADSFRRLVGDIRTIDQETVLMIQLSPGALGGSNDSFRTIGADDIERSRQNMVKASLLAAEIGFDGVDFKLCHNHLTHRLLSKRNRRTDQWGGKTVRERCRYVIEGVGELRTRLKSGGREDFIIGARISENDLDELSQLVAVLDRELDMDFISVSTSGDPQNSESLAILAQFVVMQEPNAKIIQSGFSGTMTNPDNLFGAMLESLAVRFRPDFLGLGRQSLADPLTPLKIRTDEVDRIKVCKLCNACFKLPYCKHYPCRKGES